MIEDWEEEESILLKIVDSEKPYSFQEHSHHFVKEGERRGGEEDSAQSSSSVKGSAARSEQWATSEQVKESFSMSILLLVTLMIKRKYSITKNIIPAIDSS